MHTTPRRSSRSSKRVRGLAAVAVVLVAGTTGGSAASAQAADPEAPPSSEVERTATESLAAEASVELEAEPAATAEPAQELAVPTQEPEPVVEPEVAETEESPAEEQDAPATDDLVPDITDEDADPDQVEDPATAPSRDARPSTAAASAARTQVTAAGPENFASSATATYLGDGRVAASWELQADGSIDIRLMQSDGSGGWTQVDGSWTPIYLETRSSTFTAVLMPPGLYRVEVYSFDDDSWAYSNGITVGNQATVPEVPEATYATGPGHGDVTVSWTAPADGGSEITGYSLRLDEGDAFPVLADELSYTFEDLEVGRHDVSVAAVNSEGPGEQDFVQFDVEPVAPGRPEHLTAKESLDTPGTVDVTWDAPLDLGYPALDRYEVWVDDQLHDEVTGLTSTIPDLAPGSHTVAVNAVNTYVTGAQQTTTVQVDEVAPSVPRDVTAVQIGPGSYRVTWDEPETPGTSPITGYRVRAFPALLGATTGGSLSVAAVPGLVEQNVSPDVREAQFDGLTAGVTYVFTVAALSEAGDAEDSVVGVPELWVAPSAPTDVEVAQTGAGEVTLRFALPDEEGTSALTRFVVGIGTEQWGDENAFDLDTDEVVFEDLEPGVYPVMVRAESDHGEGERVVREITVTDWPTAPDGSDEDDRQEDEATTVPVVTPAPVRDITGPGFVTTGTSGVGYGTTDHSTSAALARTGSDAGVLGLLGMLLVGLGATALAATRRRGATRA